MIASRWAVSRHRPFGGWCGPGAAAARRPDAFRSLWLYEPAIVPTEGGSLPDGDNPMSEWSSRRRNPFDSLDEGYENLSIKGDARPVAPRCSDGLCRRRLRARSGRLGHIALSPFDRSRGLGSRRGQRCVGLRRIARYSGTILSQAGRGAKSHIVYPDRLYVGLPRTLNPFR